MTLTRVVPLACLAIACRSSDKPSDPPPAKPAVRPIDAAPATDPACAAKVKELEPWLAQHETEIASHEIDLGGTLATVDRGAIPLSRHSDWITIGKSVMAYDSTVHEVLGTDKDV